MNYQKIYNRLRQLGFSEIGAVAMLGNWEAESGCEANRLENDFSPYRSTSKSYTQGVTNGSISRQTFGSDQKGYGLAQWTFVNQNGTAGRKFNLYDFWKRSERSLDDPIMQCDFCWWELNGGGYGHVRTVVTDETDLYTAVSKLCTQYEQPGNRNIDTRFSNAKKIRSQINLNDWQGEGDESMANQDPVQKVLDIARCEVGYHEQGDNITKYAADLDRTNWYNGAKNGFPYCDVFYDWLFYKAFGDPLGREMICQPAGSAGAGCLYSAQYYKNAGRWHTANPRPGDQIFFSWSPGEYSHTGLVESVGNGEVRTIEGNTSDMVARRTYAQNDPRIIGYGRPRWELAGGSSSESGGTGGGSVGRILKKGCTGTDVTVLQENLMALGYDLGRWGADGDFGNDTYNAVVQFQRDHGLEADGEAGPDTLGALETALKESAGTTEPEPPQEPDEPETPEEPVSAEIPQSEFWPLRMLKPGMKGADVEVLCALLKARGWGVHYVSDTYGSFLEEIVREFQRAYGLEIDGIVGDETWAKLFERE